MTQVSARALAEWEIQWRPELSGPLALLAGGLFEMASYFVYDGDGWMI